MPHYSNNIASNVADWNRKTFFWCNRPPKKGDQLTVTFDEAVFCNHIEVRTGRLDDANKDIITGGLLEVSTDGTTFSKVSGFEFGTAKGSLGKEIKAVRIRATEDSSKDWLIIQNLMLK